MAQPSPYTAQPLTVDSMAKAAHLSKFHFARAFTKAYGETPRTCLTGAGSSAPSRYGS